MKTTTWPCRSAATFPGTLLSLLALAGTAALVGPAVTRAIHGRIANLESEATRVQGEIARWIGDFRLNIPLGDDDGSDAWRTTGPASAATSAASETTPSVPVDGPPGWWRPPAEPLSPSRWFLGSRSLARPDLRPPGFPYRSYRLPDGRPRAR